MTVIYAHLPFLSLCTKTALSRALIDRARSLAGSADLVSIGERDEAFPLPHSRSDEFHHGVPGQDSRVRQRAGDTKHLYKPTNHSSYQPENTGFQVSQQTYQSPNSATVTLRATSS